MTLYALYSKPESGPEAIAAVRQGFSWTAFLFTPLWALARGAWGMTALWLLAVALCWGAQMGIDARAGWPLYLLFALWSGCAAPEIAARALEKKGWIAHGVLAAPDRHSAESRWLSTLYGTRA